ncbi:Fc.00g115370.m01.CDS01 [Cosmosporella sp. VM-42]
MASTAGVSTDLKVAAYRTHLPDLSAERFVTMQKQDAHEYANSFKETGMPPWLHALYLHWRRLLTEPFKGITSDGHVKPDLFHLEDQGIPIGNIVSAAKLALSKMDPQQRESVSHHIDSPEWRTWSNPEFLLSHKGVRLDEITDELRDAVLGVLRTTLSSEGYEKAIGAMRINGFLGTLVESPTIMNEFSYNFVLFGQEPSITQPWGFSFYGHHLCLNAFFYKSQIVLSPWFTGAEPNLIDTGKYAGTRILQREETLGLQLMQTLSQNLQGRAQVYKQMKDPAMPHGRWNHDDQRHLCGAYRDNRVVPYEGVLVSEIPAEKQELVTQIFKEYLLYLPEKARELCLSKIESRYKETYFCWIGGYGNDDPFYYRLQSPIIIAEFDHHSGVFLTNKEPAKFHIHTLLRTPNGGDYGMALRPRIPGTQQEFVWEPEEGK